MITEASVAQSWVQTVLAAGEDYGLSRELMLRTAGLSLEECRLERWPIDHITRLWRAVAHLSADPGMGLTVGRRVGPASINIVSFILQSATSLRDALLRVQKFQRLISDGGRLQLLPAGDAAWLIYHPCQGELAFSHHQIEAVLAALVSLSIRLNNTPLQARQVCFSHARSAPLERYRAIFRVEPCFEQAFNGLLIGNEHLDHPWPQADVHLAAVHTQIAHARLQTLDSDKPISLRVQAWLSSHPNAPRASRQQAAQALGLSEKSLARRLQAEHTHFSQLLDEQQRQQALHWAAHSDISWSEMAHRLGYSDLCAFHRAFVRWTGQTPAAWRRQKNSR